MQHYLKWTICHSAISKLTLKTKLEYFHCTKQISFINQTNVCITALATQTHMGEKNQNMEGTGQKLLSEHGAWIIVHH